MAVTLTFKRTKETKNTVMFTELGEDGSEAERDEFVVGQLYVQKGYLGARNPEFVYVKLSAESEEDLDGEPNEEEE